MLPVRGVVASPSAPAAAAACRGVRAEVDLVGLDAELVDAALQVARALRAVVLGLPQSR